MVREGFLEELALGWAKEDRAGEGGWEGGRRQRGFQPENGSQRGPGVT